MCPLDMLEEVRGKMEAKSQVVVVHGADHGMNVTPKKFVREIGEDTGRVAAAWVGGDVDMSGMESQIWKRKTDAVYLQVV
jgi:hypothetical protein